MKDFTYELEIAAETEEVFAALTTPFQIELWSGYPAVMDTTVGTEFSLWEGDITGVNLEIITNKLLVQEWFFGEEEHKSIVKLELKKRLNKTLIKLHHSNIPVEVYDEITEGWKEYYLGSIKGMLEMY